MVGGSENSLIRVKEKQTKKLRVSICLDFCNEIQQTGLLTKNIYFS